MTNSRLLTWAWFTSSRYGNGFDDDNATFLSDIIDRMARHKLSYAVFDGDGGKHFFQAMADPHGPIAGNYSRWSAAMRDRFLEFVPNLYCGSGGVSDIVDANIAEGVWIRDTPFVVGRDGELEPVQDPASSVGPPNPNFRDGLANWTYQVHPGSAKGAEAHHVPNNRDNGGAGGDGKPPCVYNATIRSPVSGGRGAAQCTVSPGMAAAPHTLTLGLFSAPFDVDAGGVYAWSAQVRTAGFSGDQAALDYGVLFDVLQQ